MELTQKLIDKINSSILINTEIKKDLIDNWNKIDKNIQINILELIWESFGVLSLEIGKWNTVWTAWTSVLWLNFDASKWEWVIVWADNRPQNVWLIYCEKE